MKTDDQHSTRGPASPQRLPAIDVMRGIVIVLMAIDHAAHMFNAGHYVTDSFVLYQAGTPIPSVQFLTRWITHLCAPTFIFLAGWALALSVAGRPETPASDRSTDQYLLKRGLFILLLDPLWMSFAFGPSIVFQVLYAIGGSLICMIWLRRLSLTTLLTIGLGLMLFGEGLAGLVIWLAGGSKAGLIGAFLVTGGKIGPSVYVLYPLLPWLAYMILGWCCGHLVLTDRIDKPVTLFARSGAYALLAFIFIRGFNRYGNMLLYRENGSILQWLHVSKYPPSLSFALLELGLLFVCLSLLFIRYRNSTGSDKSPLRVFGQTALFFYVLHVHLLALAAWLLGLRKAGGLTETWIATVAVLLVLYPLCLGYRRIKRKGRYPLLRYL